jgi:hypothetical protein
MQIHTYMYIISGKYNWPHSVRLKEKSIRIQSEVTSIICNYVVSDGKELLNWKYFNKQ